MADHQGPAPDPPPAAPPAGGVPGGAMRSGAPADPSSGATRYSKVTILSAIEPS